MPEQSMDSDDPSDCEPVQLQPFIHQVGGHTCVLRFNETSLCKPLDLREQVFYETMPSELKEFAPAYRGVIEVELHEDEDGHITLIGHPSQPDSADRRPRSRTSSPKCNLGSSSESSTSEMQTSAGSVLNSKCQQAECSAPEMYSIRLMRSGSIEVSTQTERVFHTPDNHSDQNTAGLNPWSLKCHKRQVAKMRRDNHDSDLYKFILLENVAAQFKYPCILDLKMGTRQHGDDASEAKVKSQTKKCANTTSGAVGVRLIGMQVYQSTSGQFVCQNKYFGRKLSVDGFKEALELFLNNGDELRLDLLDSILNHLQQLYKVVENQDSFRFYSSSLLIMYGGEAKEGSNAGFDQKTNNENTLESSIPEHKVESHGCQTMYQTDVDVRMIDFAHSTHRGFREDKAVHKGPDKGYLFGVQNLILMFEDIKKKYLGDN